MSDHKNHRRKNRTRGLQNIKPEDWTCPVHKIRYFRNPMLGSKLDNEYIAVGPGGMNCVCCGDAPGSDARKRTVKATRRRSKRRAMKEELDLLD